MEIKPFKNKVWLASPTMHGEELQYMQEAYTTNWMSTIGENINVIEKNISEYVNCKHAVALASGTSALHMAMKLANIKHGERVFCTDMTFAASVNPIIYEGGIPVFIDSEYETWNMDPKALEKAFELYPEVRVVVVVHLYGTSAKMDEIVSICKKHNAILIEDAAESLGATYKGKQTGTFGDYNIISFNGNKIITGSSGGMLLTDDETASKKVRKWSTQSREQALWYQHEDLGFNYRMSNVIAGVVRGQLLHLDEHINRKREIYYRYKEGFKDLPVSMNPFELDTEPNYWLSCLIINEDAMCEQVLSDTTYTYTTETGKSCPMEILENLTKYNAEGRPIWKPMHMQPINKDYECVSINDIPNCVDIFNRGLCLPSDIKMSNEEQDIIIEIIKKCFE